MSQGRVLVIDDEEISRVLLNKVLASWNIEVEVASNGQEALRILQPDRFELALVDLKMPGLDGIQVLEKIKKIDPAVDIIIMTAFGTIETAIEAIKKGALDYITKPLDLDNVKIIIEQALKTKKIAREIENLKTYPDQRTSFNDMIGSSPAIKKVYQLIEKVATTDASVLIQGETGTGKELVARALHLNSSRRDKKFVPLPCATLAETLLESELFGYEPGAFTGAVKRKIGMIEFADGGTLFLDEIADVSPATQMKLLRVLQEKECTRLGGNQTIKVNIRLVSASNKNLSEEVEKGNFRNDLFYRINVLTITLPPLRDRRRDIPILAQHFLDKFNRKNKKKVKGISLQTMVMLSQFQWPGNVRQLENIIERAVSLDTDGLITPDDLPEHIAQDISVITKSSSRSSDDDPSQSTLKQVIETVEKDYLVSLLKSLKGNVSEAARRSGLAHATFYEKLKKHRINPAEYRS